MAAINKSRLCGYLDPKVKKQLDEYAEENYMSISACLNMILKNFFEGREIISKMGQFNDLVSVFDIAFKQEADREKMLVK